MYQQTIGTTAALGRNFDINLLLIAPDWPYFGLRIHEGGSPNVQVHASGAVAILLIVFHVCPEANAGYVAVYCGTSLDVTPTPAASLRPSCTATCNARPPLQIMMLRKAAAMYDRAVTHCQY